MSNAESNSHADSAATTGESGSSSDYDDISGSLSVEHSSSILTGNLRMAVLWLALPVLAEQLLNSLVGFVDTWLSGHLDASISAAATSAIGIAVYVNWLAELLYSLVGTGSTAVVARHWGAGERDKANRVASCSMSLSLVIGVMGIAAVYFMAPVFGDILELEDDSREMAVQYMQLVCFAHIFTAINLIGSAVLRGAGDMRTPMWVLGLVSVLNVVFSSVLVFGAGPIPAMGIVGIAWGTILARLVGSVLMLTVLIGGRTDLIARPSIFSVSDRESTGRIMRIGGPALLDGILLWTGHFLFLKVISGLGSTPDEARATFAAHIVGIQVEALNYLPAFAWGTAGATLVGQCLGAGDPRRARRGGHEAAFQAGLLALVTMVVFFFGAELIYAFMHRDPAVGMIGVPALRILALAEIPLSLTIVYLVAVKGAGDTKTPLLLNFAGIFLIRLPIGYWLAVTQGWGLTGAWASIGIDVALRGSVATFYFHSSRWAKTRV